MVAPVDGGQLLRIAGVLDRAAMHADGALAAIRTRAGGDLAPIRSMLDEARAVLAPGRDELAAGPWLVEDARRAVDELDTALATARRARSGIAAPRVTEPLQAAIDGARRVGFRLRMVEHDHAAVARGTMPPWLRANEPPTPASSTQELERILARPNRELSDDELWRVALIEDLPPTMRPAIHPRSRLDSPLARLVARPDISDRHRANAPLRAWSDSVLNNLRLSVEAPRHAAAAGTTRASATRHLARVVSRADIDHEDLRQVALVAHLPDTLRPNLPDDLVGSMRRAYVHGFLPRHQLATGMQFKALREHLLATEPDIVALEIRRHVEAGTQFSRDFVSQLAAMDELRLAEFGLTREGLLARILQSVGHKQGFGWGREQLLAARQLAETIRVDAPHQRLLDDMRRHIDEALDLVERDIRANPHMPATNALVAEHWPDFGSVGRMASTAELLAAMRPAGQSNPTGAAATAAADSLAW